MKKLKRNYWRCYVSPAHNGPLKAPSRRRSLDLVASHDRFIVPLTGALSQSQPELHKAGVSPPPATLSPISEDSPPSVSNSEALADRREQGDAYTQRSKRAIRIYPVPSRVKSQLLGGTEIQQEFTVRLFAGDTKREILKVPVVSRANFIRSRETALSTWMEAELGSEKVKSLMKKYHQALDEPHRTTV